MPSAFEGKPGMEKSLLDRWTDTMAFRVALALSALGVLPVLLLGVSITIMGAVGMLVDGSYEKPGAEELAFTLLSAGGALGFVGYLRARAGYGNPLRGNVTTTLVFLTAGVLAALSVVGILVVTAVEAWFDLWGVAPLLALGAVFAAANLVWAAAGVAWMQRLMRRYAELTGRAFDGLPTLLLSVAVALATAATAIAVTL